MLSTPLSGAKLLQKTFAQLAVTKTAKHRLASLKLQRLHKAATNH